MIRVPVWLAGQFLRRAGWRSAIASRALVETLGLAMARGGGIWVDAPQKTREYRVIFAVGDSAFKQDFQNYPGPTIRWKSRDRP